MSLPPSFHDVDTTSWARENTVVQRIREFLLALSFWTAITLPFLYIPLLVTGLDTITQTGAFLALFALNVATLVISHPYRPG